LGIPRGIPSGHTKVVYEVLYSKFHTKAGIPSGHTKRAYHGACQEVSSMWPTARHTKGECPWGIPREAYQGGIPTEVYLEGIPCVYNILYSKVHTKRAYQWGTPSGHNMGVHQVMHSMFYTKASIPSGHTKRAYHGAYPT
jgi:hypothetical protein